MDNSDDRMYEQSAQFGDGNVTVIRELTYFIISS